MDSKYTMDVVMLDLSRIVMTNLRIWLVGTDTDPATQVILFFPDETIKELPLEVLTREDLAQKVFVLQLLCQKLNVAGVITAGVRYEIDGNVNRDNFMADLGRHGHVDKIPGYTETLVVTATLPDRLCPSLICSVQRDDNRQITGYGDVRSGKGGKENIMPPWADIQISKELDADIEEILNDLDLKIRDIPPTQYH